MRKATVVGAGLAGCEAAWQLAERGVRVDLMEMKPGRMTPAHHSADFAELVCSNSLRSDRVQNAVGLLKEEMRRMGSLIMRCADEHRIPAGSALAVDRVGFSRAVTERVTAHPNTRVIPGEVTSIPSGPCILAPGPLVSEALCEKILELPGISALNFYDAAAPIVTRDSLDESKMFRASRYDRGDGDDYLNCPMTREQYFAFVNALLEAETAPVHGFEESGVFEGCMPVESMARRGMMALAFGPMKAAGLKRHWPQGDLFAVVQLRRDDAAETAYNIVGFQTRLKFPEQKRVFSMIPGLENAVFERYGVMHRNTFLNSPGVLDDHYRFIGGDGLYFAGQITGVEGYVESAASGLVTGVSLAAEVSGMAPPPFTRGTALGALGYYVAAANRHFQPMNITFSLMEGAVGGGDKQARLEKTARQSFERIGEILSGYGTGCFDFLQ